MGQIFQCGQISYFIHLLWMGNLPAFFFYLVSIAAIWFSWNKHPILALNKITVGPVGIIKSEGLPILWVSRVIDSGGV